MQTIVLNADEPESVERAAQLLRERKLVALPTDTVYGLGAVAFDAEAVAALYRAKNRPPEKVLAILLADALSVEQVADHVPDVARRLMDKFWPGALTLIVPRRSGPLDAVTGSPTIGVRVPALPLARRLLALTGPLAVSGANRSGQPNPRSAGEVLEQMEGRIHAVLNGGEIDNQPSTVVDCSRLPPAVVRPGPITEKQLRAVIRLARA